MVLESTIICIDNSDYMRNGDFVPTRMQAQQDAVSLICHAKTRSNPENNVGLVAMTNIEVLMTLTGDVGRILGKLHQMSPDGTIRLQAGIRVAHLALKHRQGKNHKTRIVVFVGSPVDDDEKELVKLAKRLKKEKVNVDIINFGEEGINTEKLTTFINTLNGKDGTSCHLVTVPPGPMLSDALLSSPIVAGEDGAGVVTGSMAGLEYGVDPNEDPELALALRVSMEEQRARQEDEARKAAAASVAETTTGEEDTNEEAQLKAALEMSIMASESEPTSVEPAQPPSGMSDFSMMTEDEQIQLAMQLSMSEPPSMEPTPTPMETDADSGEKKTAEKAEEEEDYDEVINDPEFVQSVLENLPGVDPQSEDIRSAMGQLTRDSGAKSDEKKKEEKK